MENKRRNRTFFTFVLIILFTSFTIGPVFGRTQNDTIATVEEIHVGVILDMGSREGTMTQSCISMAISDFYSVHTYYRTRIALHARDSKGQPLLALSSALAFLEKYSEKGVGAIVGAQTSIESTFLAEIGGKTNVPIISFSAPTTTSSKRYPLLVQITQDEASQARGIAAIVEAFKWWDVIIVQEDSDDWRYFIPHLVESLQDKNINIAYKTFLAASSSDKRIIEELHKLMALQQTVFVVHMSPSLVSRFFRNANKLGMMSEGYAWIMTVKTMNHLHAMAPSLSVIDSMQGVVGLKSYIPVSKQLRDFTSRWRKKFRLDVNIQSTFCIWAYDAAWSLAKAVESTRSKSNISLMRNHDGRHINVVDLDNISASSRHGSILIDEILRNRFKGLSGAFQFNEGKLVSNAFEVVNVIGGGERRVGFWSTSTGNFTRRLYSYSTSRGTHLSSLEDIIWPGGTATIPKGYLQTQRSGRKLRIGVPRNPRFPELVKIDHDLQTNATTVTGFCVDVFRAAIESLPYEVDYEFIPFLNASGQNNGSYSELIYQIYLQNYDAAVGDITITANRSLYADFTIPYTDVGEGMITLKDSKSMWIFLKPLTADLWLSTCCFFVLTGIVIWLIERPINNEFQGATSQQIGMIFWFPFSTLFFAHREKLLSNFSRFVVIVWLFVVLILTTSYSATLTSMITVQHFQLNSKENYIGNHVGSFSGGAISSTFKDMNLKPFSSIEEYADALSKGSKKGSVSIIIDEIPYIKIFLARYSTHFSDIVSMSSTNNAGMSSTNGFGFAFRKGSPLVTDMSRAIAKLREDGKLNMLENIWFKSESILTNEDISDTVRPLTFDSFRGLFLITGTSSTLALVMLYSFLLYKNWHAVKNSKSILCIQYLFSKVYSRR